MSNAFKFSWICSDLVEKWYLNVVLFLQGNDSSWKEDSYTTTSNNKGCRMDRLQQVSIIFVDFRIS